MANEPDIKLLFGVEGGASIDQGSGKQIFDDLKKIVESINGKDVLKVKVGLDDGSAKDLKDQIKGIMSGVDAGAEVKVTGLDKTTKALESVASAAKKVGQAAKESSGDALAKGTKEYHDALTKINTLLIQLRNNQRNWSAASGGKSSADMAEIGAQIAALQSLEGKLAKGELTAEDFADEMSRIRSLATDAAESINKLGENHTAVEVLIKDTKEYNDALTKSYTLLGQIYSNQSSWTKASGGASAGSYAALGANASDLSDLIELLKTGELDAQTFADVFSDIRANVAEANTAIKAAGENVKAVAPPDATARLAQVSAELKEIAVQNSTLTSQYKKITGGGLIDGVSASSVDALKVKYQEMLRQTELLKVNSRTATDADIAGVRQLQDEVRRLVSEIHRQEDAYKAASDAGAEDTSERMASIKEVIALYERLDRYIIKNQRASGTDDFEGIVRLRDALHDVVSESEGASDGISSISKSRLNEIANDASLLQFNLRQAGKEGNTLSNTIAAAYKKFGGWMLITQSLTKMISGLRQMIDNVTQIDAAMTELRKVTDETDASYDRFLRNASVRARELGVALSDVVSATADFARLNYDVDTASKLADAALVYKNVGDGVADITQATESIVSTMQAFQLDPGNVMHIVDVFNSIGM